MAGFVVHDKTWPFSQTYTLYCGDFLKRKHTSLSETGLKIIHTKYLQWTKSWMNTETQCVEHDLTESPLGDLKCMHFVVIKGATDIC
jgi:hypothetical protein